MLLFEIKKAAAKNSKKKCGGIPAIVAGMRQLSSEKIARKGGVLATSIFNCYCGAIKRCHHRR
ncbi:MAG: hypothetical protein E7A34_07505, partial [Leclercia adecarboxylata]|nr:hypothetical protein [Leclercia adecarboxylata]